MERVAYIVSRAALVILPLTAVALIAGDLTGKSLLQGRQGAAQAFVAGGERQVFDVTRYLLPPKALAAACLVVAVAIMLTGRERRPASRLGLGLITAASSVIIFVNYSRSVLIGLGCSLLVLALFHRRAGLRIPRFIACVGAVALVGWLLITVPTSARFNTTNQLIF